MEQAHSVISKMRHSLRLAAVVAVVGLTSLVGATVALGQIQSASAATPTPNPPPAKPPASPQARCTNVACTNAARAARAADFPPANPSMPNRSTWLTRTTVLDRARRHAETAASPNRPLSQADATALPAAATETTIGQFDASQGIANDPDIAATRPVWVVTVHGWASALTLPGRPAIQKNVYTEVYDEPTGTLILRGIGIAAVS